MSRSTYERLKAFCEANNVSMSQLVETRVNDFLGEGGETIPAPKPMPAQPIPARSSFAPMASTAPSVPPARPSAPSMHAPYTAPTTAAAVRPSPVEPKPVAPAPAAAPPAVPMTSAAARIAVEPPPPIIKPRQETAAPKPAEKRPDQIFTF